MVFHHTSFSFPHQPAQAIRKADVLIGAYFQPISMAWMADLEALGVGSSMDGLLTHRGIEVSILLQAASAGRC